MKYDKDGYPILSIEEYEKASAQWWLEHSTKMGLLKNHVDCLDELKKQMAIIDGKEIPDDEMVKACNTAHFIEKRIEEIKRMLK